MPDKELYTTAGLSTVWVKRRIYESEIPFIRPGQNRVGEHFFRYSAITASSIGALTISKSAEA